MLQILGSNEEGVKIRCKMMRAGADGRTSTEPGRVLYFPADRSLGQIYIGATDGTLYTFGFNDERRATTGG
jgi:hypothetical protein